MPDKTPQILVCSGPLATIANSPPLVTSEKARETDDEQFSHLVPQELHEPVTVKIEKFSAHPLEDDVEEAYHDDGSEYYEVTLDPEDGLFPLPRCTPRGRDRGGPTLRAGRPDRP